MNNVPFFTAITYDGRPARSWDESLLERVDDYFYLGGAKNRVLPREMSAVNDPDVHLTTKDPQSFLITALKVISYFTVIIPVIVLIAKAILRSTHPMYLVNPTDLRRAFE